MRKYSYLISLVLLSFNVFPQVQIQDYKEKVIAPNLDATAVFKFTETSSDLANGMVNVGIPLYDIKLKELNIPINLKYYSRGIKVSEIASSVGLGWSLNYGGIVSRQVRDKADDSGMGYLKHSYYKDMLNKEEFDVTQLYSAFNTHSGLDLIPDRFFFSLADFSGEFIFDQKSGDILQQNSSDIKIKAKFNKDKVIIGWEITDTKGNKYHFGVVNTTDRIIASEKRTHSYVGYNPLVKYKDLGESTSFYYDSWYLVKIETYYNEVIDYEYQPIVTSYYSKDYDIKVKNGEGNEYETYYSEITENNYLPLKIKFAQGNISFKLSDGYRSDLTGGKSIESISMSNFKNELISQYKLNFQQKNNNELKNTYSLLTSLDKTAKSRMFLTSIDCNDSKLNKQYSYKLDYNSTLLPNRFSTSQDAWGLYNNADNKTVSILGNYVDLGVRSAFNGAGLLTSIVYPTGKKEVFTYENNAVLKDSQKRVPTGATRSVTRSVFVNALPQVFCNKLSLEEQKEECVNEFGILERVIKIPASASGPIRIHLWLNAFEHADFGKIDCVYIVKILENGKEIRPYPTKVGTTLTPNYTNESFISTLLPGREYTVQIKGPGACDAYMLDYATCRVSFEWSEREPVYKDDFSGILVLGEGKRIKKIETFSGSELVKSQEFEYLTTDEKNSGVLYATEPYLQKLQSKGHLDMYVPFGLEQSSPLSGFRDTGLGYSNVIEYIKTTNQEKIGKINYSYTAFKNDGGGYYEWPFHLSINNEWKRGLLLSKSYHAYKNNTYELQRTEINTYDFQVPSIPPEDMFVRNSFIPAPGHIMPPFYSKNFYKNDNEGYMIPLIRFYRNYYDNEIDARFLCGYFPESIYYKRYYLTGGKYDLIKTEVTDYVNGQSVTTQTYNTYSNKHRMLTSQKTSSRLVEKELTYSYVGDQNSTLDVYSTMINKNRISPLVSINESVNGEKTFGIDYQFKKFTTNYIDIEKANKTKTGGVKESPQTILYRDIKNGNIIELETSGVKETYIYGYNNSLLIAKIENASKEEVSTALGVAVANLNTIDESKINQINNLRNNPSLKDVLITTYEYKPLVGIIKITDPKGIHITYEYDEVNRLETIKDKDGNILNKYEYNYKNN